MTPSATSDLPQALAHQGLIDTGAGAGVAVVVRGEHVWTAVVGEASPGVPVNAATLFHICSCSKRSEEHTSELQSLMRISYAVFCLKKKKQKYTITKYMHTRD